MFTDPSSVASQPLRERDRLEACGELDHSRRRFLYSLGASLGSVAFSALLAQETRDPLAPKPPHREPRAEACIFLVMEGGPSHIDTSSLQPASGCSASLPG